MQTLSFNRKYLSQGELLQVAAVDLSICPELVVCREIFMTLCSTGMTYDRMYTAAKENNNDLFSSMSEKEYVKYLDEILDMASVLRFQCSNNVIVDLEVTSDLGYYTWLYKKMCDEQSLLVARTKSRLDKEVGVCHFVVRGHLDDEEMKMIEELDLHEDAQLACCRDLFLESCKTLKTINRLVTGSHYGKFSADEYKRVADNKFYVRSLKKLLELAGIPIKREECFVGGSYGSYPCFRLIDVTPYLGRNTFIANEVKPTSSF